MAKLRWSKSLHAQIESVFATLKGLGEKKAINTGSIRSLGTWRAYRAEAHRFAKYLRPAGVTDLRETTAVQQAAKIYLAERLAIARQKGHSHQTQQARASALAALEKGFNRFFAQRGLPLRMDFAQSRREYLELSRIYLARRQEYADGTRAYPNPERLIAAISDESHAIQAALQSQGGMRSEGVGAPQWKHSQPVSVRKLARLRTRPRYRAAGRCCHHKGKGRQMDIALHTNTDVRPPQSLSGKARKSGEPLSGLPQCDHCCGKNNRPICSWAGYAWPENVIRQT